MEGQTLPGAKELWKIKISGNKKDLIAAEVLTSMYDASLISLISMAGRCPIFILFSGAKYPGTVARISVILPHGLPPSAIIRKTPFSKTIMMH
jgi:hypothetical protein